MTELSRDRRAGSKPARPSSTDPSECHEARRVMKMGDGGSRPAMNVQMATAGDVLGGPRTIVAALAGVCMRVFHVAKETYRARASLRDTLRDSEGVSSRTRTRVACT